RPQFKRRCGSSESGVMPLDRISPGRMLQSALGDHRGVTYLLSRSGATQMEDLAGRTRRSQGPSTSARAYVISARERSTPADPRGRVCAARRRTPHRAAHRSPHSVSFARVLALLYALVFFMTQISTLLLPQQGARMLGSFVLWGPGAISIVVALFVA